MYMQQRGDRVYKCQEILEEKLIILKEYIGKKNMECDKTKVSDYLMKIKVSDKGEFDLYYKPSKKKFTPKLGTLDEDIYKEIVDFIEGGWIIENIDKNDSSYIEVNKEDNKKRKQILYLKNVYEIISKYKDNNIEYDQLINAIKQVCTKEEEEYIEYHNLNFDSLQKITLRYINN